jgi:hypothetical protein
MTTHVFNKAKQLLPIGGIDIDNDDIKVLLVMTNTTVDSDNAGINFINDIITLDEMDGANYVRKSLTGEVVNLDDPNSRAEFDAADVTWTALGNGSRAVQGLLIFKFVTNDADSVPMAYIEFSPTQNPGGADFTVQWNVEGIIQFS